MANTVIVLNPKGNVIIYNQQGSLHTFPGAPRAGPKNASAPLVFSSANCTCSGQDHPVETHQAWA